MSLRMLPTNVKMAPNRLTIRALTGRATDFLADAAEQNKKNKTKKSLALTTTRQIA